METRARKRSNIYKGSISYSNLWDTLERRGLKRSNLLDKESFNLSPALVNKLRHDRNVNIDTIMYLCEKLDCQVCDIVYNRIKSREEIQRNEKFWRKVKGTKRRT